MDAAEWKAEADRSWVALKCIYGALMDAGSVRLPDLAPGIDLATPVRALADEAAELRAIFNLQRTRMADATEWWRIAHPGEGKASPDLGDLLGWLMDEVSRLMHERDASSEHAYRADIDAEKAEAESARLRGVMAHRLCTCGPKHETEPGEHRDDCEYLSALAETAEAAGR
jgi:hypothetical protein